MFINNRILIKKNIHNISFQTLAQLLPKAIMFFFVMYLAKTLGSVEYGKYEFALSLGYIAGIFFELGGNMILTKHVARNFYSSIYFALKIRITAILITLLIFFAVLYISGIYSDIALYIVYAGIGVALSSLMNLYFAFFRGAGKMKYEAIVLVLQKIIFLVLALALIANAKSGSNVLLGFTLSMVAGLVIIYLIFRKKEKEYLLRDKKDNINFKDYLKDVLSLALVEVFANVYFRLSQVFIEHYRGFEEVSLYGVSYRIIEVFTNVPAILLLALFPSFAKLAVDDISQFRKQIFTLLKYLFIMAFGAVLVCWFAGGLMTSFLGSDYANSDIILKYLCFPLFFIFPNYLITQGLIALNKNLLFAKILFTALVLSVLLSFLLVPLYGAAGSAISIGICEILIFVSGYYSIMKTLNSRVK